MNVYLAGPYAARPTLHAYAGELEAIGYKVTATWLQETHDINEGTVAAATALPDNEVDAHARQDMRDIDAADLVVAFTAARAGVDAQQGGSGGRHVETGYALAKGKPVILVGQPENVFHRLATVTICHDWHDALIELAGRLVRHERDLPQAVAR